MLQSIGINKQLQLIIDHGLKSEFLRVSTQNPSKIQSDN